MTRLQVNLQGKSFGKKQLLTDISFTCDTGEAVGIFGRNGTGKSTLLKMIFGTIKERSICIKIDENEIPQSKIIPSQKIAYLPQLNFLPAGKKVREIIPLFYQDGSRQDRIFYAPGVAKFENTKIGNLSIGELRYFQLLLIANLSHPIILLDEPFSMIEPIYREKIKELIFDLKKTKALLISDHYYSDVLEVTDRNFIIKNKTLFKIDNKYDLLEYDYLMTI